MISRIFCDALGREDVAVLDDDADRHQRRAAEDLRELVGGVDVGVIREEVARIGVDANDRARQRITDRGRDRVQDRVEPEQRREDQCQGHGEAIPRHPARELERLRLPRLVVLRLCFRHGPRLSLRRRCSCAAEFEPRGPQGCVGIGFAGPAPRGTSYPGAHDISDGGGGSSDSGEIVTDRGDFPTGSWVRAPGSRSPC